VSLPVFQDQLETSSDLKFSSVEPSYLERKNTMTTKRLFNTLLVSTALAILSVAALAQGSEIPEELVGTWYAGSGYTSAPYDGRTGQWGAPNGSGLIYVFNENGTYTKVFQSYHANGGCTNGLTAFTNGTMRVSSEQIELYADSGHIKVSDSCAPSLNTDKPIRDLEDEVFGWVTGNINDDPNVPGLKLWTADGKAGLFRLLR
jgi:hypothetical protein